MIRDNFREFCVGTPNDANYFPIEAPNQFSLVGGIANDDIRMQMGHNNLMNEIEPKPTITRLDSSSDNELDAKFSDDEDDKDATAPTANLKHDETDDDDDLPLSKVRLKEKPNVDKVQLPAAINDAFDKLLNSKTSSAFESFLNDLRTCTSSLNGEQELYIVDNLIDIMKSTLPTHEKTIFPQSKNDEKHLTQSISYPYFSLFKVLHQHEDKLKKSFSNVLIALYKRLSTIGFMMLYFLKVYTRLLQRKNPNGTVAFKNSLYKHYCDLLNEKIEQHLPHDLCLLEQESTNMFLWILPDIYREFKSHMINNCDVLKLLVSCIDSKNLRDLIYSVTQGKLTIFKNDGVIDCVRESFNYETFEQIFLWQLIQAHQVPIECLQVN